MSDMREITNNDDHPQRVDVMLAKANPQYSRAALARLFDMGKITKSDIALKPGDKIRPGGAIMADISDIEKPAEAIVLPIVYEDDDVIVINKPVGVISHARGKYWDEASVASFIRNKIDGFSGERAGIVHRLDRATSGVMICAKNQATLSSLQKQFSQRKVNKTYIAIVNGSLDKQIGLIDVPLGRNPKNPKTFRPDPAGKPAQTEFTVTHQNSQYCRLALHPLTGRTHQLRVHLQYIGHPIVGDDLYGGEPAVRLLLHAYSLEITIPSGQRKIFTAPVPAEFDICK